jgi:hypothetical protein
MKPHTLIFRWFLLVLAAGLLACSGGGGDDSQGDGSALSDGAVAPDGGTADADGGSLPLDGGDPDAAEDGGVGYDLFLLDLDVAKVVPLNVYAISPSKGKTIGKEQVLLTGSGFQEGMQVSFGFQKGTDIYVVDNGKKATVVTPAQPPGPVDVTVVNPNGATFVLEDGFLYYNAVEITAVDPAAGPTAGGVPIMVTGTGFTKDTALVIGEKIAIDVKAMDDSTLLAVTPPGQAGYAGVSVSNDEGMFTAVNAFYYYDYPKIIEVSPAAGPAGGGSVIHVKMVGADPEAQVFFDDNALEKVTFVDFGLLEVITPPSAVGFVDVSVTTPYGSDTRPDGFFYYGGNVPPKDLKIISVQPPSGPTSGGNEVQITAFGLTTAEDTTVVFGNKLAEVIDVLPGLMLLAVKAPAAAAGAVDVTVMNSNGTSVLEGGYTYQPIATVLDVTPDHGPAAGGTQVIVSGKDFVPDAQVMFGALPASSVMVLDPGQIAATTPMGSPGSVDVTVHQSGTKASLPGGFTYDGKLELYVVDPNFGAISGGTYLKLVGSGFKEGASVLVAGVPCSHVTVEGSNVITAKTPPGVPGTFDVEVVAGGDSALLPLSFTYFDPMSSYGGTWGGDIYFSMNVTVLELTQTGLLPLPDAFVMLWANPDTPYQGFTDLNGQVTFSGPDLMGEQMITASKECYSNASVVEYDATNVTMIVQYNCPSMGPPSGGPPFIPPIIKGRVTDLDKYVVIPPGDCNYNGADYPFLCQDCQTNGDCGSPDNVCADLLEKGKKCLTPCQGPADCPLGFNCAKIQGGGTGFGHCKPLGGKFITFCSTTQDHFLAATPMNGKGAVADEDGNFYLLVDNLKPYAVVCISGVQKLCQDAMWDCTFMGSLCKENGCFLDDGRPEMTAYAMGVKRNVEVKESGQVIADIKVQMSTPMNRKVNLLLDDPYLSWEGPNQTLAYAYVKFTDMEGVFRFMEITYAHIFMDDNPTLMTFEHLPANLTGDLEGATYAFFGGALTSGGGAEGPVTFGLLTGLDDFEDDDVLVKGSEGWQVVPSGVKTNLYDLWGAGWNDMYGVGMEGAIFHFNGYSWQLQQSATNKTLRSVYGADGHVWAVGDGGAVVHFDGTKWQPLEFAKPTNLAAVWASAQTYVVAAGAYTIELWNGGSWQAMPGDVAHQFYGLWGVNSQNMWAVGEWGKIVRLVNGVWVNQPSPTGHTLRDVWGTDPSDVWAVGDTGTVIHFDGSEWKAMDPGTLMTLNAVWGTAKDDVTIVGNKGMILHYDGENFANESLVKAQQDLFTLFGSKEAGLLMASGNHQLVMGPFVTPVVIVYPSNGSTIDQKYLQWQAKDGGPDASFHHVTLQQPSMGPPIMFWDLMTDGDVTYVDLPDFPNIEDTPCVPPGTYIYSIDRVLKDDFDIDAYSWMDYDYTTWRSFSYMQFMFVSE